MWLSLWAVFLISFSILSLEIISTRFLSVALTYHFVFLSISTALLGLGLGGLAVHFLMKKIIEKRSIFLSPSLLTSLFSLAIPVSMTAIILIGKLSIGRDDIILSGLIIFIPFFFAGSALALIFRLYSEISSYIYGADLMGAAAASFGVIQIFNILGGVTASLFLGLTASIAALLLAFREKKGLKIKIFISLGFFLCIIILLILNSTGAFKLELPVGLNPSKEIHEALHGSGLKGKIIETKWSSFGRTDLVKFMSEPGQMHIYLDGTAGTPMYRFSGDIQKPGPPVEGLKKSFPGYFPFLLLNENQKDNALIIGPGGGRDILLALSSGIKQIIGVEVNPDLVELVKKYADYNGGIFNRFAQVEIEVDEGRSFLRRRNEKYDIILLSLPVTATSRSPESFSLVENFLFTTNSINEYLDHLTREGQLIVVCHGDFEIARLFSLVLSAFAQKEIKPEEAMKHIYMIKTPRYPVFVLGKSPFQTEFLSGAITYFNRFAINPKKSYFPFNLNDYNHQSIFTALLEGRISFEDYLKRIQNQGYDISPVSDNNPFFYKFEPGIPFSVQRLFRLCFFILIFVLIGPLIFRRKFPKQNKSFPNKTIHFNSGIVIFILLFLLLGAGFMLVEISLFQKFILFLGQPITSMAVILMSLLLGASAGSFYSGKIAAEKIEAGISKTTALIFILLIFYILILPPVFHVVLGLPFTCRVIISALFLLPLGFTMGFPFPLGLRAMQKQHFSSYIPWMWAVNGTASVLGSALTLIIAVSFGFNQALLAGAFCYLTVTGIFLKGHRASFSLKQEKTLVL